MSNKFIYIMILTLTVLYSNITQAKDFDDLSCDYIVVISGLSAESAISKKTVSKDISTVLIDKKITLDHNSSLCPSFVDILTPENETLLRLNLAEYNDQKSKCSFSSQYLEVDPNNSNNVIKLLHTLTCSNKN
ncbi:hypothetical protein MRY82_00295 [bacterium]|nr:hypothetical protein [bacterium]